MPIERVLIVDDEEDMLAGLRRILTQELEQVEVVTASRARQALRLVRQVPIDLALLDIRMPEIDGLELLEALRKEDPWLTAIMMTAYGTIEVAVAAMKLGAYDFITKPFEKEPMLRVVRKALERNRLIRENRHLRLRVGEGNGFEGFVGQSLPMRRLCERIQAIAHTDYTVLIRGESGTGKELVARAIHALSKRGNRPLISVSCPAVPENLLESEFFGHKRGAFTGADRDHTGLFEEAHGGSLFLDEIADIPVSIQTKLLRALQEQEIKPLGAAKAHKVDVRILASTNQNIEEKIQDRTFREDLYYRLNVVTIKTPSLQEISQDIPLLANHFSRIACSELALSPKRFTAEALEELRRRPWPGNVRELQNLVRRVVMFSPHSVIRSLELRALEGTDNAADPLFHLSGEESNNQIELYGQAKDRIISRFTHDYVADLLAKTGGNVTRSAELSGLGRASLQKIMRRLGIRSEGFRKEE
ncbi:MAG: sigma-54-dependent Fis family transcriptional regulator [Deltaproteobacteria bacterium]|nr:sigma-54-dependent Fis family transcriptional regulator [Deltaproteobacteria bacterium]